MGNSAWPIGQPSLDEARETAAEHVADERGKCRACEPAGRISWPCPDWHWAHRRLAEPGAQELAAEGVNDARRREQLGKRPAAEGQPGRPDQH